MRSRRVVLLVALVLALVAGASLSWAAAGSSSEGELKHAPVTQLPPGLVIVAHARTPDGVAEIGLHRIRYLGRTRLCLSEAGLPGGGQETCVKYPVGGSSEQHVDHGHLFMGPVFSAGCSRKPFLLFAAVVLGRGLTASLQSTDLREAPMHAVATPAAFGVRGPLVYDVVGGWQPLAILLRDSRGRTVSHISVLSHVRGACPS